MNDLVSVIINVYNGEKFIKRCLESIINQTYKNLEILIINDGSTDDTLKICESYKDDRIRIITTENLGLSLSRNVGIENSKGEYLYFVDIDDYVELDVIEYLYNMIKKYDTLIATCDAIDIYDYDFKIKQKKERVEGLESKEMLIRILLSLDRSGTTWNKLFKKEIFKKFRFENRIIEDVAVIYKIIIDSKKIAYSNQIKYYYLRHRESITGLNETDRCIDWYKASVERYDYIKKIYPDLYENEICLNYVIMDLYLSNNEDLLKYLKEENALELYKKLFTIKVLFTKMKFGYKMKIILLRINPKICKKIYNCYMLIKHKLKSRK